MENNEPPKNQSDRDSAQPPDKNSAKKPEVPDPFDPAKLRLDQNFGASLGVKKLLTTIPARKPSREWFVQTHPDPSYCLETAVVELKEDRETYLVIPELWSHLAAEPTFSPRALFTASNAQGVIFLWPIRLPGPDGKLDDWSRSAMEAALLAREKWCRITANMSLGAYEVLTAEITKTPSWPTIPFREILQIAFRDRLIDSLEHPALKKLRGEF